uniref:cytochrome c oxidase subunit III n=1 Tax=Morishitium polonicum TaxID=1962582 RepID=UPI0023AA25F1|nr:cytochrome c oxidase subunit III [Morishitium polonicum]WCD42517.1 cytochrome c oxidase subunit 3 [Morishitium polonicum]
MSWLSLYNAWGFMLFLLSLFLWSVYGLVIFLFMGSFSVFYLVKESMLCTKHYVSGFWMFIFSEIMAFATLLYMCLNSEEVDVSSLSDFFELPFLGCFLLIGSSLTITAYHHYCGSKLGRIFLFFTIILGVCFIILQCFEFYGCDCDISYCVYQASCFCTVGLHFSHVLAGVIALSVLYFVGEDFISDSSIDFIVWYWHFVDYVWLFVYLIVYLS